MKRASRLSLIVFCLCIFAGCSQTPGHGGKKGQPRFGVLSVRLKTLPPKGKRLTYAVATVQGGRRNKHAGFQPLTKEGAAVFVLPMNKLYNVRIFCDLNRNQLLDPNEPNGFAESLAPSPASVAEVVPFTLAFGEVGTVNGGPYKPSTASEVPYQSGREIPAEAEPYLKYMPQWLRDKLLE